MPDSLAGAFGHWLFCAVIVRVSNWTPTALCERVKLSSNGRQYRSLYKVWMLEQYGKCLTFIPGCRLGLMAVGRATRSLRRWGPLKFRDGRGRLALAWNVDGRSLVLVLSFGGINRGPSVVNRCQYTCKTRRLPKRLDCVASHVAESRSWSTHRNEFVA